jgi:Zn-dependent protease
MCGGGLTGRAGKIVTLSDRFLMDASSASRTSPARERYHRLEISNPHTPPESRRTGVSSRPGVLSPRQPSPEADIGKRGGARCYTRIPLEPSPEPLRPFPPLPSPLPSPPKRRVWLHALLFGATCLTVTLAGLVSWAPDLRGAVEYAIAVLAIMTSHEMGHYVACRRYGIPASLPYFVPGIPPFGTFGAVIRIRGSIPNRKALFDVAAAGPIAGFAVALVAMGIGLLRATPIDAVPADGTTLGSPLVAMGLEKLLAPSAPDLLVDHFYGAGLFGMLLTSLNLFPVGQLDGGHAVYAAFARWHRAISYATIGLLLAFSAYQGLVLGVFPQYVVWLVVLWVLRDRHPRLVDETSGIGTARCLVAVLLLVIAVVTFIPRVFVF